ncbi:ThiF family adenylyltransferase [Elongatibacter sediminis]|uniref:ThiF family adenylyltransferase n=1 Tax=Elongatibacter sediminis TaxID=3119006 RepID=A0AAW9RDK5_9GAMM
MTIDLSRYNRQMLLPGFGEAGQRRLAESTALILGCGALGTVAADGLARAGVGHLIIVDRDFIELSNLQRQVLFDEDDVAEGLPKAEAARRKIARINSQVQVTAIVDDINHTNIARLAADADILVDGLDNIETRYLVNDCAVKHAIPYVYGGAVGTTGMACAILPHSADGTAWWETSPAGSHATPCLRCLFPEAPGPGENPTCDTVGVIGPAVTIVAAFEVNEALKILTGNLDRVNTRLLNLDLWSNSITQLDIGAIRESTNCPCCRQRRFDYLDGEAGSTAAALCGRNAVQLRHRQSEGGNAGLEEIAERLRRHGQVKVNEFMLRAQLTDNGQPFEVTLFADGRAIVKGTDEATVARGIYARFIGN